MMIQDVHIIFGCFFLLVFAGFDRFFLLFVLCFVFARFDFFFLCLPGAP